MDNASQPNTLSANKSVSNEEENSSNINGTENAFIKDENISSESDILHQAKQIVHSRKFKM